MIKRICELVALSAVTVLTTVVLQSQTTDLSDRWQVTREKQPIFTLELIQSGVSLTRNWINPGNDKSQIEKGRVVEATFIYSFTHDPAHYGATGQIHCDSIVVNVQEQGKTETLHAFAKH